MEARLIAYYWSARGRPRAADRRRALVALQRALKVVGRLHYIALAKGKPAPARVPARRARDLPPLLRRGAVAGRAGERVRDALAGSRRPRRRDVR